MVVVKMNELMPIKLFDLTWLWLEVGAYDEKVVTQPRDWRYTALSKMQNSVQDFAIMWNKYLDELKFRNQKLPLLPGQRVQISVVNAGISLNYPATIQSQKWSLQNRNRQFITMDEYNFPFITQYVIIQTFWGSSSSNTNSFRHIFCDVTTVLLVVSQQHNNWKPYDGLVG